MCIFLECKRNVHEDAVPCINLMESISICIPTSTYFVLLYNNIIHLKGKKILLVVPKKEYIAKKLHENFQCLTMYRSYLYWFYTVLVFFPIKIHIKSTSIQNSTHICKCIRKHSMDIHEKWLYNNVQNLLSTGICDEFASLR